MARRTHIPAKVIRPDIAPGRRVLAVSDIHGNLPFLEGLLHQVSFSPADVLVLVGDLLEKGQRSLDTLQYVLRLSQDHTVYALCGNCDYIDRMFLEGPPGMDEDFWPVYQYWAERSLIEQMRKHLGHPPLQGPQDFPALREAIRHELPQETQFLLNMPQILEAGNFLFVHGGVPREDRLEELKAYPLMKYDNFMGQGLSFQKWVVVGHWPVTLYRTDVPSAAPILDQEHHIASIDGGCVLKLDGQLNALIIPDITGTQMTWEAYDGLPLITALQDQAPNQDTLNIRWSDSAVDPLRTEGDCTWCRHRSTGRELWIPSAYLFPGKRDQFLHTEDTTDYLLPVQAGEKLRLSLSCSRGILAKKDGVSGWYLGPWEPA